MSARDWGSFVLHTGDCRDVLKGMADASVDSVVCDPPYELGFMGRAWDSTGIANDVPLWREVLRVLKPGGHLLAFSGTRTYHRMVCAIEDAGFDVRDMMSWVYGSGFPKSHDISKAIDKAAGADREVVGSKLGLPGYHLSGHDGGEAFGAGLSSSTVETRLASSQITAPATVDAAAWQGWGTALKPAHEPIVLARKPLIGTVASNVLAHGTGGLNIDGCRVPPHDGEVISTPKSDPNNRVGAVGATAFVSQKNAALMAAAQQASVERANTLGRFPANLLHDGSPEVLAVFPSAPGQQGDLSGSDRERPGHGILGAVGPPRTHLKRNDTGVTSLAVGAGQRRPPAPSAARFFYAAKASGRDRNEGCDGLTTVATGALNMRSDAHAAATGALPAPRANTHPTVKPTDLMRYLCRLITPPGGLILDPFMGSGSTGKAAVLEGFRFVGVDLSDEYVTIAERRIAHAAFGAAAFGGVAA